jgi:hypothetical protein
MQENFKQQFDRFFEKWSGFLGIRNESVWTEFIQSVPFTFQTIAPLITKADNPLPIRFRLLYCLLMPRITTEPNPEDHLQFRIPDRDMSRFEPILPQSYHSASRINLEKFFSDEQAQAHAVPFLIDLVILAQQAVRSGSLSEYAPAEILFNEYLKELIPFAERKEKKFAEKVFDAYDPFLTYGSYNAFAKFMACKALGEAWKWRLTERMRLACAGKKPIHPDKARQVLCSGWIDLSQAPNTPYHHFSWELYSFIANIANTYFSRIEHVLKLNDDKRNMIIANIMSCGDSAVARSFAQRFYDFYKDSQNSYQHSTATHVIEGSLVDESQLRGLRRSVSRYKKAQDKDQKVRARNRRILEKKTDALSRAL